MPGESDVTRWLQEVALGAASAAPVLTASVEDDEMVIGGKADKYIVYGIHQPIATNDRFKLYPCTTASGRSGVLKIATDVEHNAGLEKEAYILRELKRNADELEEEYAKVRSNPQSMLNYDLGFPQIIDSFIFAEQGNRAVNILAFRNVDDVGSLNPLINLADKKDLRVDLRSSAWIMGKLLKLLDFAHSEGFALGLETAGDILIEPDKHYVMIFDWSLAKTAEAGELPRADQKQDISLAAQAVFAAIGGNLTTGDYAYDDGGNSEYVDHLLRLARGAESNAELAHSKFYELVDSCWKREFYPFTTLPLH